MGSLCSGLANPNSQSGTQNKIFTRLETSRANNVLLMFGQVDLHIGYLCKPPSCAKLCPHLVWLTRLFTCLSYRPSSPPSARPIPPSRPPAPPLAGQLKSRGPSALGAQAWTQQATNGYTSFLEHQLLPRLKSGQTVYVAGVAPPIVEDRYLDQTIAKYAAVSPPALPHIHERRTRSLPPVVRLLQKEGAGSLPPLPRYPPPSHA